MISGSYRDFCGELWGRVTVAIASRDAPRRLLQSSTSNAVSVTTLVLLHSVAEDEDQREPQGVEATDWRANRRDRTDRRSFVHWLLVDFAVSGRFRVGVTELGIGRLCIRVGHDGGDEVANFLDFLLSSGRNQIACDGLGGEQRGPRDADSATVCGRSRRRAPRSRAPSGVGLRSGRSPRRRFRSVSIAPGSRGCSFSRSFLWNLPSVSAVSRLELLWKVVDLLQNYARMRNRSTRMDSWLRAGPLPGSIAIERAVSWHGAIGMPPIGGAQETSREPPYCAEARIDGTPAKPLIYEGFFPCFPCASCHRSVASFPGMSGTRSRARDHDVAQFIAAMIGHGAPASTMRRV